MRLKPAISLSALLPFLPVPSSPSGHPGAGWALRLPRAGDGVGGPVQTPRCGGGCIAHAGRRCWPGAGLPKGEQESSERERLEGMFPNV